MFSDADCFFCSYEVFPTAFFGFMFGLGFFFPTAFYIFRIRIHASGDMHAWD